eukprot:gene11518-biopygen16874
MRRGSERSSCPPSSDQREKRRCPRPVRARLLFFPRGVRNLDLGRTSTCRHGTMILDGGIQCFGKLPSVRPTCAALPTTSRECSLNPAVDVQLGRALACGGRRSGGGAQWSRRRLPYTWIEEAKLAGPESFQAPHRTLYIMMLFREVPRGRVGQGGAV